MATFYQRLTLYNDLDTPLDTITSYVLWSQQINQASWAKALGGSGVAPIVTADQGVAPDGTSTADKVVFNCPAGAGNQSNINQNGLATVTSGALYTGSIYVKAFAAGDIGKVLLFRHVGRTSYTTVTLTASWQRVTSLETAFNTSGYIELGLRPDSGSSSGTVTAYVWCGQVVAGTSPGDPVATVGTVGPLGVSTCGTDPLHTRPYLIQALELGESKVDFLEGRSEIGQINVKVLDKRTTSNQNSGWLTAILSDTNGENKLIGRRASLVQNDGTDAFFTVFDGVITDIGLDDDNVTYTLSIRDPRESERAVRLFSTTGGSTSVHPPGIRDGYGTYVKSGGSTTQVIPAAPVIGGVYNTVTMNGVTGGAIRLDSAAQSITPEMYQERFANLNGISSKYTSSGAFAGYVFPNVIVRWRDEATHGAWNTLVNMPQPRNSDMKVFDTDAIKYKVQVGGSVAGLLEVEVMSMNLVRLFSDGTGSFPLPANGQRVEVQVLSNLPPSEQYPFWWEGNLGQLLKDIYDGVYSYVNPKIRYNAAAMASFIAICPTGRIRITDTVDDMRAWVEENIYKPMGYAPAINSAGEIVPVPMYLPDASVTLVTLDDTNCAKASWKQGETDAVTRTSWKWHYDKLIEPFPTKGPFKPPKQVSDIFKEGDREDIYLSAAAAYVGIKEVTYEPVTFRDLDVPDAFDAHAQTSAARQAQKVSRFIVDRMRYGGQHIMVEGADRSDPSIAGLGVGDWVICGFSNLPDYGTHIRGMSRLAQVISVKDTSPVSRVFELLDSGPNGVPLSTPTITSVIASTNAIQAAVTAVAGAEVAVEYAINATQPSSTSPLWQRFGRGPSGTYTTPNLPVGVTVWVRARSEAISKRPSAWVNSASVGTTTTLAYPSNIQINIDDSNNVTVQYEPSSTMGGARIYYYIGTSPPNPLTAFFDQAATTNATAIPGGSPANPGDTISVKVEGWTGFAAGAVSGTQGFAVSKIVNVPGTNGDVVLPPSAWIEQSSQSVSSETVKLNGTVGTGGASPLSWTKRITTAGTAPGAWDPWVPATGGNALPFSLVVPRHARWGKIIEFQTRDANGVLSPIFAYTVESRIDFLDDTTGNPKRSHAWDDGHLAVPATATDASGFTVHAGVVESGGKTVNRLFAKPLSSSTDNADSVNDGLVQRTIAYQTLRASDNYLLTGVYDAAVIGGGRTAASVSRGAHTSLFSENWDTFSTGAWTVAAGAVPTVGGGTTSGTTRGQNVLIANGYVALAWNGRIPFDRNKLYRFRYRFQKSVDETSGANAVMYAGFLAYDADGNAANNNGGANYVLSVGQSFNVASGWIENTAWVKGATLGYTTGSAGNGVGTPDSPAPTNIGTVFIQPYLLINYPLSGIPNGQALIDYFEITEYDEDGQSRVYSTLDNVALGRLKSAATESGGKAVNRLFAKPLASSTDNADSINAGTSKRIPLVGATDSGGNIDLGGTAWVNKNGSYLSRSAFDSTDIGTVTGQLTNAGHAGTGMQESGGKAVNRLFAKSLSSSADTADSVNDGLSTRTIPFTILRPSDNALLTRVDTFATIGSRYAANIDRSAHSSVFNDIFDSTAGWNVNAGSISVVAESGAQRGTKVLQATGYASIDWGGSKIPFDPNKLYRFRARYRKSVDDTAAGVGLVYIGIRAFLYDNNPANDNGGSNYILAAAHHAVAGAGWFTMTSWIKGADLVYAGGYRNGTPASPDPAAPGSLNIGTTQFTPYLLLNYPSSGVPDGTTQVDYFEVTEYDEDGGSRLYSTIDNVAPGRLKSTATESGGKLINRLYAKPLSSSADTLDSIGDGVTNKKVVSVNASGQITPPSSAGRNRCKLQSSAVQGISNSSVSIISFDSEFYDVGALHSPTFNISRITVPGDGNTGAWHLVAEIEFAANATGRREVYITKNGNIIAAARSIAFSAGGFGPRIQVTAIDSDPAVGDFYDVRVFQDSGGALNVSAGSTFAATHLW